ncbi:MAG: hypothetical protein ACRBK7_30390 [Acidimicrobiales bacterium]
MSQAEPDGSLMGLRLVDPLEVSSSELEVIDPASVLILLDQLSAVDNNAGPNSVLPVIESQQERVTRMLNGQSASNEAHYAASRFAEFRGWIYHDLGKLDLAMQWTNTALDLAMAGGCDELAAYHWMRKSNIASDANKTQLAVAFARSSRGQLEHMTPRLRAVAQRQEAYAHALDGKEYECSALLDAAFNSVGQGAAGEDLATYCSESYIEMESANAWIELGRHNDAIPILESADQDWSNEFRRDHGLCKARLSLAYAGNHQPIDALEKAREGVELARVTDSARSWHFLQRAATQLRVIGANDEADELSSQLPLAS